MKEYVSNHQTCKEAKPANMTLRPSMVRELFTDFPGPYPRSKTGNTYIVIVLDQLTKYVLLKTLPKASAKHVIRFLIAEVFHKFGTPEEIVSDNGKQFTGRGITHTRTAIHAPQANSSERVN